MTGCLPSRRVVLLLAIAARGMCAEKLAPETQAEFERYVRQAGLRIETQVTRGAGFLFATTAERREALRAGKVLIEPGVGRGEYKVVSGLVHDWAGAVFIPGVTVAAVLERVQSYDRHKQFYQPEVIESRLLSREGNEFRARLRLVKRKTLTVVLDTEHEIHYERRDDNRWWSRSRTVRVSEIQNPGKPNERALAPGTGRGFVWALDTWWAFQQLDGGVYVECEAISLSRTIPKGLAWLIEPIIRSVPRESLENTLNSTRKAVLLPPAGR